MKITGERSPAGFERITLSRHEDGSDRGCVHYWADLVSSNIHSHVRSFESWVLTGVLHVTEYQLEPQGVGKRYRRWMCAETDIFETGESWLTPWRRFSLRSGLRYVSSLETIHQVVAVAGTSTLVSYGRPHGDTSVIYGDLKPGLESPLRRELDDERIGEILTNVLGGTHD